MSNGMSVVIASLILLPSLTGIYYTSISCFYAIYVIRENKGKEVSTKRKRVFFRWTLRNIGLLLLFLAMTVNLSSVVETLFYFARGVFLPPVVCLLWYLGAMKPIRHLVRARKNAGR